MTDAFSRALQEAAERERGLLWGLSYRVTGSASEAEDVVQQAFVRALEARPAVDDGLRPWLCKVAVNLSLDALRRRQAVKHLGPWLPGLLETPPESFDAAPSSESEYTLKESVTLAFLLALEVLSPEQRAVLVLRDVFGSSARETGVALALTEAAVRQLHHRARKALEPYDADRCVPDLAMRERSRQQLEALMQALLTDDVKAAALVLRADVKALNDGGNRYLAARVPLLGFHRVYTFYRRLVELGGVSETRMVVCNGLWALDADIVPKLASQGPRAVVGVVPGLGGTRLVFTQLAPERMPAPWHAW